MTEETRDKLLENVSPERRASVIKLLAAGAFAVPMVSSFAMKRFTLDGHVRMQVPSTIIFPPTMA